MKKPMSITAILALFGILLLMPATSQAESPNPDKGSNPLLTSLDENSI
jgi:hypothetical protein